MSRFLRVLAFFGWSNSLRSKIPDRSLANQEADRMRMQRKQRVKECYSLFP